jgi:hypothetical protein
MDRGLARKGQWNSGGDATPMKPAPCPKQTVETPPLPAEDGQEWTNRRASDQATRAANARQVSGRRRFVDPTTCEREYSMPELEFMQAMHEYKQSSGRMFPTWSEVLEVVRELGYQKGA